MHPPYVYNLSRSTAHCHHGHGGRWQEGSPERPQNDREHIHGLTFEKGTSRDENNGLPTATNDRDVRQEGPSDAQQPGNSRKTAGGGGDGAALSGRWLSHRRRGWRPLVRRKNTQMGAVAAVNQQGGIGGGC